MHHVLFVRLLAAAAVITAVWAVSVPDVHAQYIPGQCGFAVTPSVVQPGDQITFTGSGAPPDERLTFYVADQIAGSGTVRPDGTFSISGSVPVGLAAGQYTVTTVCGGADISTIITVATPSTEVIPGVPGSPGSLPRTGFDALWLVKIGLSCAAVGGLFVLHARRRRATA